MEQPHQRWQDRVESKIDQLSEAVVALARVEERVIALFKRVDSYEQKQEMLAEKLEDLDKTLAKKSIILSMFEKTTWIAASAAVTAWVLSFWNHDS